MGIGIFFSLHVTQFFDFTWSPEKFALKRRKKKKFSYTRNIRDPRRLDSLDRESNPDLTPRSIHSADEDNWTAAHFFFAIYSIVEMK